MLGTLEVQVLPSAKLLGSLWVLLATCYDGCLLRRMSMRPTFNYQSHFFRLLINWTLRLTMGTYMGFSCQRYRGRYCLDLQPWCRGALYDGGSKAPNKEHLASNIIVLHRSLHSSSGWYLDPYGICALPTN